MLTFIIDFIILLSQPAPGHYTLNASPAKSIIFCFRSIIPHLYCIHFVSTPSSRALFIHLFIYYPILFQFGHLPVPSHYLSLPNHTIGRGDGKHILPLKHKASHCILCCMCYGIWQLNTFGEKSALFRIPKLTGSIN